ncbi:MAG: hypothetical protein E7675_06040 [Ruminococcaceae bacterium]|nr:hypothetical protein [Oscillospiraceae bacterium]
MYRPNKKTSIGPVIMKIAASLFCLVLISTSMLSGLYARYTTTSSTGDSARVITFGDIEITETGDFTSEGKLIIIPGVDLTKKATVSFEGSEASTVVFVTVTPSAHFKTNDNRTFTYTLNSKDAMEFTVSSEWSFLKLDNGDYVYYKTLIPNKTIDSVDIFANDSKISVSDEITKSEISTMTGIYINLGAVAVQSNGFENITDAWSSVSSKS